MYLKKYADIAEMPTSASGVSRAELLPSQRAMLDEMTTQRVMLDEMTTQAPSPKQLEMMRDFLSMNRQRRRSIIAAMKREAKKGTK